MDYKKASKIMLGVYGLDCLVITPYILFKGLGQEAGLLMSWGYNLMGLGWFYLWFGVFSVGLFFGLKYFFKFLDWKLGKLSKYPKYALLFVWVAGMVGVIINNLRFVL